MSIYVPTCPLIHISVYLPINLFSDKNTAKFKEWLDINTLIPSYKPSQAVIELFGYLAYETVQEVSVWTNIYILMDV